MPGWVGVTHVAEHKYAVVQLEHMLDYRAGVDSREDKDSRKPQQEDIAADDRRCASLRQVLRGKLSSASVQAPRGESGTYLRRIHRLCEMARLIHVVLQTQIGVQGCLRSC